MALYDGNLILVPLGDWEKNPRLKAKTLGCLRYGKVPRIQPYSLRFKVPSCVDHKIPQADLTGRDCQEVAGNRARNMQSQGRRDHNIKGHVSQEHVHIFVSVPPHISVSPLVQSLRGKSSWRLLMEYKGLNCAFWGRHLWARGYFVGSSGNVTDGVIVKYIEEQGKSP